MLVKKHPEPPPTNFALIPLGSRIAAIVDPDDFARFGKYHYRLVKSSNCFYPMRRQTRNGKTSYVRLAREIMNTLPGYECHHINHNPRDCRRSNLQNLTPAEHATAHHKS